jgi:hypothetical protein
MKKRVLIAFIAVIAMFFVFNLQGQTLKPVLVELYDFGGSYPDNVIYPEEGTIEYTIWMVNRPHDTQSHPGAGTSAAMDPDQGRFMLQWNMGNFNEPWSGGEIIRIELIQTTTGYVVNQEFAIVGGTSPQFRLNHLALVLTVPPLVLFDSRPPELDSIATSADIMPGYPWEAVYRANNWELNDYWEIEFSSEEIVEMEVAFALRRQYETAGPPDFLELWGPRFFQTKYSTDGLTWFDTHPNDENWFMLPVNDSWTSWSLTLPEGAEDQESIYVRWVFGNTSGFSNNGWGEIKDVVVTGAEMPSPNSNIASNPSPADGAEGISVNLEHLGWRYVSLPSFTDPAGFRVYLNETGVFDLDDDYVWVPYVAGQANYTDSDILPDVLDYGVTYYWQVVPTTIDPDDTRRRVSRGDAEDVPVWSFTTFVPVAEFFEDFDDVVTPDLPDGWFSIVESTEATAYIRTWSAGSGANAPISPPNQVQMATGPDEDLDLILITPPVTNFAENYLEFWAKISLGSRSGNLIVGIMDDPAVAATFTAVDTIHIGLNSVYTQYGLIFPEDTPAQNIAFKLEADQEFTVLLLDDIGWQEIPDVMNPPQDLAAVAGEGVVNLSWSAPAGIDANRERSLAGYNVYRNAVMINTDLVTETAYEDTDVLNFIPYEYYVTAVYFYGESDPSNVVQAMPVLLFPPENLTATAGYAQVELEWDEPDFGSWINWDNGVNFTGIGIGAPIQFDAAIRFSPADLTDLEVHGKYLTTVRFYPRFANCVYTVKVWTGGSSTQPGTMVVEQLVTDPQINTWNEVILNNAVYIDATEELWFGYHVNTQGGNPAGADPGPALNGSGNMMYFNNQWTTLLALGPTLNYNWNIQGFAANVGAASEIVTIAQNNSSTGSVSREERPAEFRSDVQFTADPLGNYDAVTNNRTDENGSRAFVGYNIYRDGNLLNATPVTVLEYTDQDVVIGTEYTYQVTAYYDEGESIPTNSASATPYDLNPPQNLTAEAGSNLVSLEWDVPDPLRAGRYTLTRTRIERDRNNRLELLGYNVYRDGVMINTNLVTATEYEDTGALNDVTYIYHVTAVYDEGESGPSNTVEATPEAPVLNPPQNLTTESGDGIVWLEWEEPLPPPAVRAINYELRVAGTRDNRLQLLGYNVYRDDVMINTSLVTITEYEDSNVVNDVNYIYYVTAVYDEGESEPSNPAGATPHEPILLPPSDLTATVVDEVNVMLEWEAPEFDRWIHWDSGVNSSGVGTGSAFEFKAAARFSPDHLEDMNAVGKYLRQVKFFPRVAAAVYTVNVWTGGTATQPGTLVIEQPVPNIQVNAWNTVALLTPVAIEAEELWIGYHINTPSGYPAGVDAGPAQNGMGNMMYLNNEWTTLLQVGPTQNYNWNIQGYISSAPGREEVVLNSAVAGNEPVKMRYTDPAEVNTESVFNLNQSSASVTRETVTGFRIYRNGEALADVEPDVITYLDEELDPGIYEYYVTALYDDLESAGSNTAEVEIEDLFPYPPMNLTYEAIGDEVLDIQLLWDEPEVITGHLVGYNVYRDDTLLNTEPLTANEYLDVGPASGTYIYYVTAYYDFEEESEPTNEVTVIVTSAGDTPDVPFVTALRGNYPNPFNPETTIKFSLQEADQVTVEIYNTRGQRVKTLVNEHREAGEHQLLWNGRDDHNRDVSSGVYFYRMKSGRYTSTKKMLMMK